MHTKLVYCYHFSKGSDRWRYKRYSHFYFLCSFFVYNVCKYFFLENRNIFHIVCQISTYFKCLEMKSLSISITQKRLLKKRQCVCPQTFSILSLFVSNKFLESHIKIFQLFFINFKVKLHVAYLYLGWLECNTLCCCRWIHRLGKNIGKERSPYQ